MMKIIDLSLPIENCDSEPMRIIVKSMSHKKSARKICFETSYKMEKGLLRKIFGALKYIFGVRRLSPNDFPNSEFITNDIVTLGTHMGTHIDAPYHFGYTKKDRAIFINELPLDWFYGNGVRLDFRHKKSGELITAEDIKLQLRKSKYELQKGDIVLIWTGADKNYGTKKYFMEYPGMSKEAVKYLVDNGIKVIGTDAYGFDRPFGCMIQEYMVKHQKESLWPAHFCGRDLEYVHIEKMCNLEQLNNTNFQVCCFPIKIYGADAGWTRVVAMQEE